MTKDSAVNTQTRKFMPPFTAAQFTATVYDGEFGESRSKREGFDSRAQKARTVNHLIEFLLAGCPRAMFPKWFYQELHLHFALSAEGNIDGFWHEWFSDSSRIVRFVAHLMDCESLTWGDARYTYSDVIEPLRTYIQGQQIQERLVTADKAKDKAEVLEMAARLMAGLSSGERDRVMARALEIQQACGHSDPMATPLSSLR